MNARVRSGEEIIRFENVALGYGKRRVLENVDLSIASGDFIGVVGPNGSGKTTLLRSILGMQRPLGGRIDVPAGVRFGYVVQRQTLDPLFPVTVEHVVEMGRYGRLGMLRRLGRADRTAIENCLEVAGVREIRSEPFRSLSGGQKQRVLIARALAADPDIMLLDEPTNDLDVAGENTIMDLIHDIHHQRAITVVMVSHLLHVVLNHVEKLALLRGRTIEMHAIPEVMEPDFLSSLYNQSIAVEIMGGKKVIVARRNHAHPG
jgi:ABC-type Mn2+/Zn2+ transport system ATPase subunit